jgi:hypothetical protein
MPSIRANPFEICRRARIVFAGPFTLWVSNENRHSGAGRNPENDAESGGAILDPGLRRGDRGRAFVQIPLKSAGVHELCLPVHSPYGRAMKTVIPAQAGIQGMMPNRGTISGPRPAPG